ncbi:DEAD/DEAH box helicase [Ammoniphilus resinae]|uniref:Protein translocase subunit SecA n=1 Tax=Ammoniphilus resinae TaxID=861532 RepID=A0ABS4GIX0_9BACL|nr:DEAD/DEAH box helicase [Ammoniphilus resinae]MBP1930206.1 preprotein translocase subunit SecA [Ammoniphilus resinae]
MRNFVDQWIYQRKLKAYRQSVQRVCDLAVGLSRFSDEDLRNQVISLREKRQAGDEQEDIKIQLFAVVKVAIKRVLEIELHDEQVLAGIVLTEGKVAEMATGEGKTVMSVLPAVWFALEGKGVHLMTVNEYLARRDYAEMGKIFNYLGLSVGLNISGLSILEKKSAYLKDITYGVCNEFGFDYLRDRLATNRAEQVQRELSVAIVDEIDCMLIDEAKTPLIIAAPTKSPSDIYYICTRIVRGLQEERDYEYDHELQQVMFTEEGIREIETSLQIDNLYDLENVSIYHYLLQSLRARVLMRRDVHYIVAQGKVNLIDTYTGRILEGRQLNDGLHQAIEAKENVSLSDENKSHATITIQKFFGLYRRVVGMTGTILTEEEEIYKIYGLQAFRIPTHRPVIRQDDEQVFLTKEAKYLSIVQEVEAANQRGQPVLIGTTSIAQSEEMAHRLRLRNLPYRLLNAKTEEGEAKIIANAGQKGSITIATNMAGRGTDIRLGEGVSELGGLYVIGSEHHESRRIDHQLRGRAGRQGDVGKSCFFISLEDEIVERFAREKAEKFKNRWSENSELGIRDKDVLQFLLNVQTMVEKQHFEVRQIVHVLDSVVHDQRTMFYQHRQQVLEGTPIFPIFERLVKAYIERFVEENYRDFEDINLNQLLGKIGLPIYEQSKPNERTVDSRKELTQEIVEYWSCLMEDSSLTFQLKEPLFQIEYLKMLDDAWVGHLEVLEHLKQGIHYRAFEQRNPLVIYNDEAWFLYQKMEMQIQNKVYRWTLERINRRIQAEDRQKVLTG